MISSMIKPEKKLQDKVVRYLRDRGIYYLNLYGDGMSGKGKPDIIACLNGKFVAFELKVGANDMQDDQKIHKIRIERSKGLHFSPYTLEEFISIVEALLND
jgi:Holliday junction resolvase